MLLREKAIEDLLRDITQTAEPSLALRRASELGYDLLLRRVVVVVESAVEPTRMIRTLRKVFDDPQDIVGSTGAGRFVVLGKERKGLRLDFGPECVTGIGAVAGTVDSLHDSYQDALTALDMAARFPGIGRVVHVDDVRLQELVASSAERTRVRFVRGLLGCLPDLADWPVLRSILIAWCESGFSLVRAAAELRIHRNTLVHRLAKIEDFTGLDTRDARLAGKLYLACVTELLG